MILKPISTEKSIRQIETENKLIFLVEQQMNKTGIKEELEKLFNAKVEKIRTMTTPDAKKRAIVTFKPETPAIDIATKLGLM